MHAWGSKSSVRDIAVLVYVSNSSTVRAKHKEKEKRSKEEVIDESLREMKVVTVLPSSRRAVGVEVVDDGVLQVAYRAIALKAIAFARAIIADTVAIAFIQRVTP